VSDQNLLDIWTVYDHPGDYPEHYVTRRWELTAPKECYLFETLEAVRAFLSQKGLSRLERCEQDDPKIIETWI